MRTWTLALSGLLLLAACAGPLPTAPMLAPVTPAAQAVAPQLSAEAASLRRLLAASVPQNTSCNTANAESWIGPARAELAASPLTMERPQLLVVVDRNPRRQELCILLAVPNTSWKVIGGSRVSTGQSGRRGYFITPTGAFVHGDGIVDYRAEGTFNDNHIRGLGVQGMRVWDFGWQQARKGWTQDGESAEIRLLLHATDPDTLEQRLGRPASKGCVRIPAAMNRFLDHYGVLDAAYNAAAPTDPRIAAVLPPGQQPTPLAGDILVVIDTSHLAGVRIGAAA